MPAVDEIFIAWKGQGNDQRIFMSRRSELSSTWDPQILIPNVGTSTGPSLIEFDRRICMAWKGVEGDNKIFFSSAKDGTTFDPQVGGPFEAATSAIPALAVLHGSLFMAWKGVPGDQGIFFSRLDNPHPQDAVPESWTRVTKINGIGTSSSPILAVFQDKLHMVWKGVEGDQRIFASVLDEKSLKWTSGITGDSSPQRLVNPNIGTSQGPFLATFAKPGSSPKSILVWKGIEGDQKIFTSIHNEPIHGIGTTAGSTLGQLGSGKNAMLFMAWKGVEGDQRIFFNSTSDPNLEIWDPQQLIPGVGTSGRPSLSVKLRAEQSAKLSELRNKGIDFSVPEADLLGWLDDPVNTPYPVISEALFQLLGSKHLRKPVFLDVIVFNYEHTPGVSSPRKLTEVFLRVLKEAVVDGYNERHGEDVTDFQSLLI